MFASKMDRMQSCGDSSPSFSSCLSNSNIDTPSSLHLLLHLHQHNPFLHCQDEEDQIINEFLHANCQSNSPLSEIIDDVELMTGLGDFPEPESLPLVPSISKEEKKDNKLDHELSSISDSPCLIKNPESGQQILRLSSSSSYEGAYGYRLETDSGSVSIESIFHINATENHRSSENVNKSAWIDITMESGDDSLNQKIMGIWQSDSDDSEAKKRDIDIVTVTVQKDCERRISLESFELRCPPGGEDRVVLYFTSLGGIRKTLEDCNNVRAILHSFNVFVDERDVSMDASLLAEMKELVLGERVVVPRLFVRGRYIGGAEDVLRLHEEKALADIFQQCQLPAFISSCQFCHGLRFILCPACNGSRRRFFDHQDCLCSSSTDHKLDVLRCVDCNENGLVKCPRCFH